MSPDFFAVRISVTELIPDCFVYRCVEVYDDDLPRFEPVFLHACFNRPDESEFKQVVHLKSDLPQIKPIVNAGLEMEKGIDRVSAHRDPDADVSGQGCGDREQILRGQVQRRVSEHPGQREPAQEGAGDRSGETQTGGTITNISCIHSASDGRVRTSSRTNQSRYRV